MNRFVRPVAFATAALLVATTSCNDQPTAPKYAKAARFIGRESNALQDLVRYEFTGAAGNEASFPATSVAAGLTASSFTRGSGLLNGSTAANAFTSTSWTGGTSIDANDYVEFTVAPTTGGQFTASEFSFAEQRSGTGPPTWLVRLVRTDGSFLDLGTGTSLNGTLVTHVLPIPTSWQGPYTDALRVRIFAFGATGTGGTFRQDNVILRTDGGTTPLTATGAANPSTVNPGNTTFLTATITSSTPGTISVVADLSSIGEPNNAQMFDDGVNGGDVTAGDKIFSRPATVATSTTLGTKTLPISLSDNQGRTGSSTITLTVSSPPAPPADVVISQVYGGGGNAGAPLNSDFIELFNRGNTPASLDGWSVQYNSATGAGTWSVTRLQLTIPAHGYYLVREAGGTNGIALPAPDTIGSIAMALGAGKVILSNSVTPLTGNCPTGPTIIDRVGYGAGADPDGCNTAWGGRTDATSNTTAAFRLMNGCFNTTKGGFDFLVQAPAPRNSASPTFTCPAPSSATIVVNEILAEPFNAEGGASWGEWFEVKNTGSAPVDLQGWTITTQGQAPHIISTSVVVPPGGLKVLGRGFDPALNGGVTLDYNYFTSTPLANFLDARDFIMLTDQSGGLVDIARWTNSATIVLGSSLGLRDPAADNIDVGGANWGYSTVQFGDGDFGTPGAENGTLASAPLVFPNKLVMSGRVPSDPALPVGWEAQLFASEVVGATGDTLHPTMTWAALTPTIASIDADGVIHSLTPGSAQFRATAPDGITATVTLAMSAGTLGTTAQYGNNTEFGDPIDSDPSDDFIIRRDQFTTSYNKNRNTPNWVSYNLESSHIGSAVDRCNCFTMDPLLPASFLHINTNDYTGAGGFAGYGIDRGHMARSFDRTSGELDNAYTYLLSNVIPQAADLNQGPWAVFETFLGNKATAENKEIYIIVGVAGSKGFIKGESKIVMPARVWKVAVIMPKDKGLADVHTYQDLEVIAINAPNDPGVRGTDWHDFITTVDAIEALSGYDLLSLLPDNIEAAVESNTKPPIGVLNGPWTSSEGSAISMSSAGSFDPNGSIVSYAWNFGDGTTGIGATPSHSYAQDGNYTVTLTLTDNDGLTDVVTSTATVSNVAPTIAAFAGATFPAGGTYTGSGSFTDPGADTWTATVNYGDGSGTQPLSLSGGAFSLSHTYATAGSFTVTVSVSDDDATSTKTASVTVLAYPVANAGGPYTGLAGASLSLSGAGSTDPDGTINTYAWTFGDGSTGSGANVSHTYAAAGNYVATLTVTDNDGLTNEQSVMVAVLSAQQALQNIATLIDQLPLGAGNANSFKSKIDAAIKSLDKGNKTPARNQLNALLNEINAKEQSGALSNSDAAALRAAVLAVLATI